ncbi:MAG: signal peptide peptidase SppA [Porphyrobacter sp.]|nr:signal peptide peptidase SppA [Porphyrobacter sp.]
MSFVGKVWKVLVGVKDALVLLFMLLFFVMLFGILSARPSAGQVREGALLIDLDGSVVEEKSALDPISALLSGTAPVKEYRERDIVRALDAAATDDRIKAVVFDLTTFTGGGQVHLTAIGEAMDRVRAAKKPVLTYAIGYADDHMMLAAHASEVWLDPQGAALVTGPGGSYLYYADLLNKLGVNAHIFRAGEYKSATEPYSRSDMSPEARENVGALYAALWEEWQANVKKARPQANLAEVTGDTAAFLAGGNGDLADAALKAGLVDKLGDRVQFGERVAAIAGKDRFDETPGAFAASELGAYLADIPAPSGGKKIGVVTVAGEIVDGDAGPGTAGGARIADVLDAALDDDLAALVVRIDSPGGSVTASEEIRRAVERFRARKIPVAVSFANIAASGGYWVATAGERIFAQPETITGSIGVFAVLPSFEQTAAKFGVNADGYRTTPLSGQPDVLAGFSPEIEAVLQAGVASTYRDFLARVSKARGLPVARVDAIGGGRVWDGGTARQLGLVDQFGGLDDALAWAAAKAGAKEGEWHPVFLGEKADGYDPLIRRLIASETGAAAARASGTPFAIVARRQDELAARLSRDIARLTGTPGVQALCLECPGAQEAAQTPDAPRGAFASLARLILAAQ